MTSTSSGITEAMVEAVAVALGKCPEECPGECSCRAAARRVIAVVQAALAAQKGEGVREGRRRIAVLLHEMVCEFTSGDTPNDDLKTLVEDSDYWLEKADRVLAASPTPAAWNEAERLLTEVIGYAKANADAAKTEDERMTWAAHHRNCIKVQDALTRPDPASEEK